MRFDVHVIFPLFIKFFALPCQQGSVTTSSGFIAFLTLPIIHNFACLRDVKNLTPLNPYRVEVESDSFCFKFQIAKVVFGDKLKTWALHSPQDKRLRIYYIEKSHALGVPRAFHSSGSQNGS